MMTGRRGVNRSLPRRAAWRRSLLVQSRILAPGPAQLQLGPDKTRTGNDQGQGEDQQRGAVFVYDNGSH